MSDAKQDFAALTTLRAVGALCVVELHAWQWFYPRWSDSWLYEGFVMWPDYFFALSGFILMHVYGKNLFSANIGLYKFFIHRIARIYPLHIFVLLALIALEIIRWAISDPSLHEHFFHGGNSPKYIVTNLLLIQAWGIQHTNSWNVSAWSISAEFACYLLFPVFIRYDLIRRKLPAISLALASTAGLIWIQLRQHNFDVTYDLGVPRAFFSFTLGCLLYHYRQALLQRIAFIPPVLLQSIVIATVISAYIVNALPLLYIPLWLLLIASLTYEQTLVAKALSWGPLVELGEMSYSIYMVHIVIPFLMAITKTLAPDQFEAFISWPPVLILLIILGSVCLISVLTYRYIEKPTRAYMRKRFTRSTRTTEKVADAYAQ
jgi:peptidoglycan/LPS O-acetylase OafA/YrhL